MKTGFCTFILLLVPLVLALAGPSPTCVAWYDCCLCHPCRCFVDDCTICAWKRTWNGPNALATPLRGYYIPRPPQCCNCGRLGDGCHYEDGEGYAVGDNGCHTGQPGPEVMVSAETGFSPVQFERLGQVPNDLDLGMPAASAMPPAAAAR